MRATLCGRQDLTVASVVRRGVRANSRQLGSYFNSSLYFCRNFSQNARRIFEPYKSQPAYDDVGGAELVLIYLSIKLIEW